MAMGIIKPTEGIILRDRERFASSRILVDPLLDEVVVRVRRPTSADPLAWGPNSTLLVNLVVFANGERHVASSSTNGGIRTRTNGIEFPYYELFYSPTTGFFGAKEGYPKRLGEQYPNDYKVWVEFVGLGDPVVTEFIMFAGASLAPRTLYHGSVAFDAATAATDVVGNAVISLTHTATGSNLAAVSVTGWILPALTHTSTTYNAVSMTELWDATNANETGTSSSVLANPATGAKTVTSTMSAAPDGQSLGVFSATGVDQTTPSGNVATPFLSLSASSSSLTVTGVGSDDLVFDGITAGAGLAVGALQTRRWDTAPDGKDFGGSTQAGSDGGVMSWTFTAGSEVAHCASVLVSAAAAAAAQPYTPWPLRGPLLAH